MNFNRRDFLKGVTLATAAGVSPRLVASGTTLAAPDMAKGVVRPGMLQVVEHDVDVCVVGGGPIGKEIMAMRLIPLSTYFSELKETVFDSAVAHIFAFEPV